MRYPRAHEIEHGALDPQFGIQLADRGDGSFVDVGDEPGERVEPAIGARIGTIEEPGREGKHGHGRATLDIPVVSLGCHRTPSSHERDAIWRCWFSPTAGVVSSW